MSIHDYPLPSYAAYIWMGSEGELCLLLPGETGKGHILRLPKAKCQFDDKAWTSGWSALSRLLQDRAQNGGTRKIGNAGEITQAQLEEALKHATVIKAKVNAPADLALEDLGL